MELFAGVAVSDLVRAAEWYERLLGSPPTFEPNENERVWTLADGRHVYVELRPADAGHAMLTLFVDTPGELDTFVRNASGRGVEPTERETYDNGVQKVIYRDPDGNEFGLGSPGND